MFNELTPDIEEQLKSIDQEKARLTESIEAARAELEKVDVTGVASENLTEAREALDKAKAEVMGEIYTVQYLLYLTWSGGMAQSHGDIFWTSVFTLETKIVCGSTVKTRSLNGSPTAIYSSM